MLEKTRRLFIGIPLEEKAADQIENIQLSWRKSLGLEGDTLISKSDFHLTLHFLGEIENRQVDSWLEALEEHTRHRSFSFVLNRFLAFPDNFRARVITLAGSSGNSPLSYLFHQLGETVERLGCRVERRVYVPHVTLFRGRELKMLNPIQEVIPLEIEIKQFALYESRPGDKKNRYEIVKPYLFKAVSQGET